MILIVILFLFTLQFLIISSYESLNNLSVRTLLVPETDDVEESTKNTKEVNRILSYLRILIIITIKTPNKFPNKSDHSKLLAGIIK